MDDDLFAKAMQAVRPIKKDDAKVGPEQLRKKRPRPVPHEPMAAVPPPAVARPRLDATDDPWTIKASGVSQERLKRLAAGNPPARTELDLHGMTRDEALHALETRLAEALAGGERALAIIHGRGLHSQGRPVLKEAVYQWLREGPFAGHILAVIPRPDSGGGACLVLLRRARNGR